MSHPLDPGTTTFGTLVDGYEDTEHFPCTFKVSEFGKITIEVSFPHLEPFNLSVTGEHLWVNKKPIPNHMVFRHSGGQFELFGIRFTGSSSSFGSGKTDRITCEIDFAVEGQVPEACEELPKIVSLRQDFYDSKPISNIAMHKVNFGESVDPNSPTRSITVPGTKEIWRWEYAGIEHAIFEVHKISQEHGRTEITSRLELESTTLMPMDFHTLHSEQRKFVALMQIVNNKQIPLISPRIRFTNTGIPTSQNIRSGRVRTSLIRESSEREVKPCISPSTLKSKDILQWYERFEKYERAISALSSLLPRIEIDAEERMINSFIALESVGHLSLNFEFGKQKGTSLYVEECMRILAIDSLEFAASIKGFATALANNYNGIKHLRASTFPDAKETFMFGLLAQAVARAALLKEAIGAQVDWFRMTEVELASSVAKKENLMIDEKGDY